MKKLLLVLLGVSSMSVFANDGGVTGIVVEDLQVYESDVSGENRTPMAGEGGVEAHFSGAAVRELMKLLPGNRAAGFEEYGEHFKSLTFAAKEGYVSIDCGDADFNYENNTYTPVEPRCSVSIMKYAEAVSDDLVTDLFGDFNELSVPNACVMR